jgi:putative nucleotidyltransferase with HDIG domain
MGTLIDINELLKSIDRLPVVRSLLEKTRKLFASDDYDLREAEKLIALDMALSTMILKLANSPAFFTRRRIDSLREAIMILGSRNIKELLVLEQFRSAFPEKLTGYNMESRRFWNYNLFVAKMAERLAGGRSCDPDIAYTAGLLHDIGKVVIAEYLNKIKDRPEWEGTDFFDIRERELLGYSHNEVGAMILERWGMGENLVLAARNHHQPGAENENIYVDIVHIASVAGYSIGLSGEMEGTRYEASRNSLERLGIAIKDVELMIAEVFSGIGPLLAEF